MACAVKSSLSPVHRPDLEPDCEVLAVQIGSVRPVIVAVCYRPPDADDDVAKIAGFLHTLRQTNQPFLMVGDLNLPEITWLGDGDEPVLRRRTARAVTFIDAVAECDVTQSVTQPTRGDNILDIAISYGGAVASEVCDKVFASDHSVVVTQLTVKLSPAARATRSRVYNYKDADFNGLRRALHLIPWDILKCLDVNKAVNLFYDIVFAAIADHIPMIDLRQRFPPWFDRSVRDLLREKEAAHRRKKSHPTAENVAAHARLRADFKMQTDVKYREYLLGLVREFKENPKRYWSFIKSLKSRSHVSPVLECDGRVYKGDEERANCFNMCFARKYCDPRVDVLPAPPVLNSPGLSQFTVPRGRISLLLRELNAHKACGADGLSARIIKECADVLAVPLEIICDISVRTGVFPAAWKQANVIPVYKKGSRKRPENYRPVSLLPICSKILEKVVCESLLRVCLPALPTSQHGFLPRRSCITNLACFLEHCWSSISKGKQTDAIYTDYSSAFTSVNHILLLHKLRHSFNITGHALSWVKSYLDERTQRVVLNGKHSGWTPVQSGVPEGSILGPILFACYIADIPQHMKTNCIMYADDVKLFHRIQCHDDVKELQADLDRLLHWSNVWRLKLNPTKCMSISFTLRTSPVLSSYILDGHELERCDRIRDLGVLLDSKLTFAHHIDTTMAKANKMLGLLMRSMQMAHRPRGRNFDHTAVMCAFNAHVRSVLEYACVIWSGAAVSHLARLERLQHRFLMWLAANTRANCPSLDYNSLLLHFNTMSIKSRFVQADVMFLCGVLNNRFDCDHLVPMFGLTVPGRRSRHTGLLHEPFARVNVVKSSLFTRLPRSCNALLHHAPSADIFHYSSFKRAALEYARTQAAYNG